MDRLKLRSLLDTAQQQLAVIAGLPEPSSLAWRIALGPSNETGARVRQARKLLGAPGVVLDQLTRALMQSNEAMAVVCERFSRIRRLGDRLAHVADTNAEAYSTALHAYTFPLACLSLLL